MVGAEPIKGDAFQLDGSQAVENLDAHDDQGVQSLLGGELKQVVNRAVLNDVCHLWITCGDENFWVKEAGKQCGTFPWAS